MPESGPAEGWVPVVVPSPSDPVIDTPVSVESSGSPTAGPTTAPVGPWLGSVISLVVCSTRGPADGVETEEGPELAVVTVPTGSGPAEAPTLCVDDGSERPAAGPSLGVARVLAGPADGVARVLAGPAEGVARVLSPVAASELGTGPTDGLEGPALGVAVS